MGIIRLFLAISVLLWHCPPGVIPRVLHPALAVQCFYAISGFLMQLAITRYYKADKKSWPLAFYKSRLFRLMPLYWLFASLTLIMFGNGIGPALWQNGDVSGFIIYVFNNIAILGQDVIRLFSYNTSTHHFSMLPPFTEDMRPVLNENVVFGSALTAMGQSWTLSVEMWFYLALPFLLLRSSIEILGVIVLGIMFRCWIASYGYVHHTFLYGIILCEISIFLAGSLAARFYKYALASGRLSNLLSRYIAEKRTSRLLKLLSCVILAYLIHYYIKGWRSYPNGGNWGEGLFDVPYRYWVVILATILAMPWLMHLTGKAKWDRFIGDLSYPVYISHLFVMMCVQKTGVAENHVVAWTLALSLCLSIALIYLMERPVDAWRHKRFLHTEKAS